MPEVVLAIGLLVTVVSGFLFVHPTRLHGLLDTVFGGRWLYGAALMRFLLGAGLIASAETVAFSPVVSLFGWVAVLGGLLLVVIPAKALLRMAAWFTGLSLLMTRLRLCLAIGFGLFLLYAAMA